MRGVGQRRLYLSVAVFEFKLLFAQLGKPHVQLGGELFVLTSARYGYKFIGIAPDNLGELPSDFVRSEPQDNQPERKEYGDGEK